MGFGLVGRLPAEVLEVQRELSGALATTLDSDGLLPSLLERLLMVATITRENLVAEAEDMRASAAGRA